MFNRTVFNNFNELNVIVGFIPLPNICNTASAGILEPETDHYKYDSARLPA